MNRNKTDILITEEQFNAAVIRSGKTAPEDDSRGDSNTDDAIETELGINYPNDDEAAIEELNDNDTAAPETTAEERRIESETSDEDGRASTWPDETDLDQAG